MGLAKPAEGKDAADHIAANYGLAVLRDIRATLPATPEVATLPVSTVVLKHGLRNALVPVVALAAVQLGFLLGGSIVIETIFALDGLGYLAYQSISHKDFPVTQAVLLLLSVVYVLLTLMADVFNALLDPRMRHAR